MNDAFYNNVKSWSVDDSGDNLSDHNPKRIEINVNANYIAEEVQYVAKPLWHKANEQQKNNY